ncbi:recombinase family protein [Listeria innocua]|uniref:recombinase family protein n=1 Tax=Listeria innocua TaxID=1642 RepID=UPI0016246771|nr:recombinase family protein [Listeria innocua]MBC1925520.1 recombinase family protein [Listeria innocua]
MARIRKSQQNVSTTQHRKWKVAIYVRLSHEDGNNESLSITNQKKIIQSYLDEQFQDAFQVVQTYIDDGISAVNAYNRPAFQEMIADVKSGRVDTIICKSLSRAFRNSGDQTEYLRKLFPEYNTRFISIDTPYIDTYLEPRKVYQMDVSIFGSFNESYPLMISEEIHKTFREKRNRGEFIGAFAPYGYRKNPENKNHFLIDDEPAEIVRLIFKWYVVEGLSIRKIVARLNQQGVSSPSVYKKEQGQALFSKHTNPSGLWGLSTVSRILRNQVYLGTMVQGRAKTVSPIVHKIIPVAEEDWVIIKDTHEAIVSEKVFEHAQRLNAQNRRVSKKRNAYDLFSGLLKCADCQQGMSKKASSRKSKRTGEVLERVYYGCTTYLYRSKESCSYHGIKLELLEDAVLQAVQAQIAKVSNLEQMMTKVSKETVVLEKTNYLNDQKIKLKSEITKLERVTSDLYMDWKTEVLTRDEYVQLKSEFSQKTTQVKAQFQQVMTELALQDSKEETIQPYFEHFRKHGNITKLNRQILQDLIETIYIHENKEITIKFRFAEQEQEIVQLVK